ncbi:MAG TPA: hypothetical protein VFM06_02565 [Candidatus Limnocylindria bacterium]|nr:hypothetical protein [Candidatus Limnocylindria bacterium]
MAHDGGAEREAWDYDVFVRHYDEIASELGGWMFDREGPSPEKLREWYETAPIWETLRDFARTRFQLDQQM